MRRENFAFEGLSEIESRLRRLAPEVAYLTLADRTERNHEEPLGRFDFTMKDALPYLEQIRESSEPSDEPPGDDWLVEDEGPELEEELEEEEEANSVSEDYASFAEAGCRWLRDLARRNTVGETYRRFRVRAYTRKGARVVDTASFVCKNIDYDLDLPMPVQSSNAPSESELRIPSPSFDEAVAHGAAQGLRDLGNYYSQWGQIVFLGSVGQMQGVNNAMLARLHRQLQESRNQVDQLVAAILEFRVAEFKASDEVRANERKDDQRTELVKHTLQQLGEVAKTLLVAKGIPAELGGVLGTLQQNPNLISALTEPDVQALLEEPQNLDMLAGMLRQFGQQARLLREATTSQAHPS